MKWAFRINLACSYQWYCTLAKAAHLFPGTPEGSLQHRWCALTLISIPELSWLGFTLNSALGSLAFSWLSGIITASTKCCFCFQISEFTQSKLQFNVISLGNASSEHSGLSQ